MPRKLEALIGWVLIFGVIYGLLVVTP